MSASVWGMEHFTHYLTGKHFVLYTDHKPLVNLGTVHTKALSQIQEAMWKYDFEIMNQKGSKMPADFLSRNVVSQLQLNRINSLKLDDHNLVLYQDLKVRGEPAQMCLVLPSHKITKILEVSHGTLFTGHEGKDKTKSKIHLNFW